MEKETKKPEVKAKTKSNKVLLIIIGVVVVLLAVGFIGRSAFKKIGQKISGIFISKMLSKGTNADVNVEDGGKKVTYKGQEGEFSFEEGGTLPDNFPKDFPIYPGSKLISNWSSKGETSGISVMWETSDAVDKVGSYFKTELVAKGWKITSSFEQTDSKVYSFEKGTDKGLVGITKAEEKINISVTVGIE